MVELTIVGGTIATLFAGLGLFLIARWALPLIRVQEPQTLTSAELNEIEGYAAIRQEISDLSRAVNGLATHMDGQHEIVMKAIRQMHETCKHRRQA